jgi:hypothetical protein
MNYLTKTFLSFTFLFFYNYLTNFLIMSPSRCCPHQVIRLLDARISAALTTDVEKGTEQKDASNDNAVAVAPGTEEANTGDDVGIMRGVPLIMFTVGMMAIVFLMCLDHYILGTTQLTDSNALPNQHLR